MHLFYSTKKLLGPVQAPFVDLSLEIRVGAVGLGFMVTAGTRPSRSARREVVIAEGGREENCTQVCHWAGVQQHWGSRTTALA